MAGLNRRLQALERLFGPAIVESPPEDPQVEPEQPPEVMAVDEGAAVVDHSDPETWAERTVRVAKFVNYLEDALEHGIEVPEVGSDNEIRKTIRRLLHSCAPPLGPFCASCDDWMTGLQFDADGATRCAACRGLAGWLPSVGCDYFGHRQPCHCGYDYRIELTRQWFWALVTEECQQALRARADVHSQQGRAA